MNNPLRSAVVESGKPGTGGSGLACSVKWVFSESPPFSVASWLAGSGRRSWWVGLFFVLLVMAGAAEPPKLSGIGNRTIDEDTSTGVISFGVFPTSGIAVSGSSSNTNLVPNANISITFDAPSWLLQVTPAANQSGTAQITLIAQDSNANVGATSFVLTVNPVDDAVTVRLVNPTEGQVFLAPGKIELIAEVSDPDDRIVQVEFLQTNNEKTTSLDTRLLLPFAYTWTDVQPADYTLEAVAIDRKGARTTSEPVLVQVRDRLVRAVEQVDVLEGTLGQQNVQRTIQIPILGIPSQSETITYWTSQGTEEDAKQFFAAYPGINYRPIPPTEITIGTNTLTTTLTVDILGNLLDERNKRFYLNWSSPNPGFLISTQLMVNIIDDDLPPTVSINDVQVFESSGEAVFTLSLSSPSLWENTNQVEVAYTVVGGSATADRDFAAATGTVTIPTAFTSGAIRVPILNDRFDEPNETFFVDIQAIRNVVVAKGRGQGIILDDDGPPEVFPLNAEVTEGERMRFNVALSLPSGFPIDVDYTTAAGTALAGIDYESQSGRVHFEPLQTNAIVWIPTLEDRLSEAAETFLLRLSNPTNAVFPVPAPEAIGTILDNEAPPVLTINTAAVLELDAGVANALFTVTLAPASGQFVRVNYATADGTAHAGEDYTATSGVLEFQPGEISKEFVVPVLGDTIIEKGNELFFVNLTVVGNTATPSASPGIGIIVDNEPFTRVSITDATLLEGDSGVVNAIFSVILDEAIDRPVTVDWATTNRTALAFEDYLPDSGTITFGPGDVRKEIFIQILGDTLSETAETFVVGLSNPKDAQISKGEGIGTIENDDPVPSLSLDGSFQPTAREGSLEAVIQLRLSEVSGQVITLDYTTRAGTASAGADFDATPGTVTIPAGENVAVVRIPLINDPIDEFDETFSVVFSNPVAVSVVFEGSEIPMTILDDDEPPVLVFAEQRIAEGSSGVTSATVEVRLSGPSEKPITAKYQTQDGTARSSADYRLTIGSVTFEPGRTNQPIPVEIIGDEIRETDEVFYLRFEEMTNLSPPALMLGAITIGDDDTVPGISVAAVGQNEGNDKLEQVTFVAMLTAPSEEPVSFEYKTEPGTALPLEDYFPGAGTVTIDPGASSASFAIYLNNDRLNEENEEFSVRFSPPRNALFEAGQDRAIARILNDDPEPTVTVRARSLLEDDKEILAVVTVTLSEASGRTVTLDYATEDGTAIAGLDYRAAQGSITLPPGQTERQFVIPILGDRVHEPREDLGIRISNVTHAIPAAEVTRLIIVDDDPEAQLSIANARGQEGDLAGLQFVIRLAAASAQEVTVQFSTADGTAVSAEDFEARQETVTLPPGETEHAVIVAVRNDTIPEPTETFLVRLTDVTTGRLIATAEGTILDDDAIPQVTIGDAEVEEGNSGFSTLTFPVQLSGPSASPVTVGFASSDETAEAGVDYVPVNDTLTFAPGITEGFIRVQVFSDLLDEDDETFLVTLTVSDGSAVLSSDPTQAHGTIRDDDLPPRLLVSDAVVLEGDQGSFKMAFGVRLSAPSGRPVVFGFETVNGTAVAGEDYEPVAGVEVFPAGQVRPFVVTVVVNSDRTPEPDETFRVRLSNAQNSEQVEATGTIINDDFIPTLRVADGSATEGGVESTNAVVFQVTLSSPSTVPVSVSYLTSDGTARAPDDYAPQMEARTLELAPGVVSGRIVVPVRGDSIQELSEEIFFLTLQNPVNATVSDPVAVGTIADDDAPLGISISDASVVEGDTGTTNLVFEVRLSGPIEHLVRVDYEIFGSTVTLGQLQFRPGELVQRIRVAVSGDLIDENDEVVLVQLRNAVGASLQDRTGVGTIVDDDPPPVIQVSDLSAEEGGAFQVGVRLSAPSRKRVTVQYTTANGSALSGIDYSTATGGLVFEPNVTEQTISIASVDDSISESTETFSVLFSAPVNALLPVSTIALEIVDNDPIPGLTISNATVRETDTGFTSALFMVRLSAASAEPVSVQVATAGLLATADVDFKSASGTLEFAPGVTERSFAVEVTGDLVAEGTETFTVTLSRPTGAVILGAVATGTILDNDIVPQVSVADASVLEGNGGSSSMVFTVRLSEPSNRPVSLNYRTTAGTALSGTDFTAASGTISIAAGVLTNAVSVAVIGDLLDEPNETFGLVLSAPVNARLSDGSALGTIVDDDPVPSLAIHDATVTEGNTGFTEARFEVRLSAASGRVVTVEVAAVSGTAFVNEDFQPIGASLKFDPGIVTREVVVAVNGDTQAEPDERFVVELRNAVNAVLQTDRALGSILNDDALPNQAPTIRIVNPLNASAVHSPADVIIEVEAADSDGEVRSVEFYVGSILLETRMAPPYRILWENDASGEYSLTVVATDDEGARTVSEPVILLAKRGVIVSEVAIVRNAPDPEIRKIQEYLLDLGMTSQVFDQGGLRFQSVSDYQLIIWNDAGAEGLTANDVGVFREALANQIPLYLIGESLAVSGRGLTGAARTDWARLTHLAPGLSGSSAGSITVDALSGHPVVNGHFGVVGDIAYAPGLDSVVQDGFGVSLLASSGSSDLVIAAEADNFDATRSVTQGFLVSKGDEPRSLSERRRLFKNAVLWLMRKSFHALTDLSLTVAPPADPIRSGVEFVYSATIGHRGEISGTGIALTLEMPPSVRFVRGDFLQGRVEVEGGDVIYHTGSLENGQESSVDLVFVVVQPGPFTLKGSVFGNEADPALGNNVDVQQWTALQGASEIPRLMMSRVGAGGIRLQMNNDSFLSVTIQASTDLIRWQNVTNTTDRLLLLPMAAPADPSGVRKFYRVVQP
jgi:hypothetical protein